MSSVQQATFCWMIFFVFIMWQFKAITTCIMKLHNWLKSYKKKN